MLCLDVQRRNVVARANAETGFQQPANIDLELSARQRNDVELGEHFGIREFDANHCFFVAVYFERSGQRRQSELGINARSNEESRTFERHCVNVAVQGRTLSLVVGHDDAGIDKVVAIVLRIEQELVKTTSLRMNGFDEGA